MRLAALAARKTARSRKRPQKAGTQNWLRPFAACASSELRAQRELEVARIAVGVVGIEAAQAGVVGAVKQVVGVELHVPVAVDAVARHQAGNGVAALAARRGSRGGGFAEGAHAQPHAQALERAGFKVPHAPELEVVARLPELPAHAGVVFVHDVFGVLVGVACLHFPAWGQAACQLQVRPPAAHLAQVHVEAGVTGVFHGAIDVAHVVDGGGEQRPSVQQSGLGAHFELTPFARIKRAAVHALAGQRGEHGGVAGVHRPHGVDVVQRGGVGREVVARLAAAFLPLGRL